MNPGTLTIYVAAVAAALALVSAIRWARGTAEAETHFRWAYHAMTVALGLGSFFLMLAILTHDYRYDYVIGYSSRDLPLIYKISAFWGGQQGTYLLWAFLGALIGYPLFRKNAWEPASVMAAYVPTVGYLLALMLDKGGNPFTEVAVVPPDGRGLNPLLQDPWMAFHPPVIFLGYAAMTVPAVLAFVALLRRQEEKWLGPALRWALIGFISLGAGIVMGGFWAYKVLGWGGYWGWDPVENASLVPWIVITALFHGLLVQLATGALRRTNLVLALASYLLVLYATFLTRSGVLADFSVHSFPAGTVYRILVAIMLITLAASVWALLRRKGPEGPQVATAAAWPFVLAVTIVLFAASAAFVLFGTSWPIISQWWGKAVVPGIPFYNRVSGPVYLPLLALLAAAPFLGWQAPPTRVWVRRLSVSLAVGAAFGIAGAVLGGTQPLMVLLFALAGAALASNVLRLVEVARTRWLNTGAAVAHIGFAFMILGIVASSVWGTKEELRLPLGTPVPAADGRTYTFRGHVEGSDPKTQWRVAVLVPGQAEETALVRMYQAPPMQQGGEPMVMRNPAIRRGVAGDLYVAPLGLEGGGAEAHQVALTKGAAVDHDGALFTFLRFETTPGEGGQHGFQVNAVVRVESGGKMEELVLPLKMSETGDVQGVPVAATSIPGLTLTLDRMSVEQGAILVAFAHGGGATQTLIVEASHKPLMNLLWLGTLLLGAGCTIAVVRRAVDRKMAERAATPPGPVLQVVSFPKTAVGA